MKLFIFLVFGVVFASAASNTQLASDLKEFKALVPTADIALIAGEHLLFDSQFRDAKKFLESSEFKQYWAQAINSAQFQAIVAYLGASGMDAVVSINSIAQKMKLAAYSGVVPEISQRSVHSFLTSVFHALPKSKIIALVKSKNQSSPAFAYFYTRVTSPGFNTLVQNFLNAPELSAAWSALRSHGINPQEIVTLFRGVFGL